MKFISLCSGIEAASFALDPLGWQAIAFAEIDKFPCAVLAHHYPHVPNFGDISKFLDWPDEIFADADVIVGGPPCQAFSIAGLRNGLNDARGNLTLVYVDLINHADTIRRKYGRTPVIAIYENVPGLLSDKTGAFGCFLGALSGEDDQLVPPGKKWSNAGCVFGPQRTIAWRVTDAQYFGVPQRRRRVFVVASARKGFDPTEVLFEFDGVRRDTAPSRQTGQDAAGTITSSLGKRGGQPDCASTSGQLQPVTCMAHGQGGAEVSVGRSPMLTCNHEAPIIAFSCKDHGADSSVELAPTMRAIGHQGSHANAGGQLAVCITGDITHTLKAEGFDASEDGTGRGQPIVAALAFQERGRAGGRSLEINGDLAYCLTAPGDGGRAQERNVLAGMAVRRLTPVECERLQAFPDFHTLIPISIVKASRAETMLAKGDPVECIDGVWWKMAADGPRYKALGNSMCTENMAWIGRRIELVLARSDNSLSIQ